MSVEDRYFDGLFANSDDPWAFRQRWYEQRKRAITLAALPRPRYRAIFEPGCANGELSADLATRCDRLLCCDTASAAVALARTRLSPFNHAQVCQARLPEQWPSEKFDLIVISELGYYLDAEDLKRLIEQASQSLTADGQLLACHWRPPIDGCPLNARQVHDLLHEHLRLPRLVLHQDADFLLELWSREPRSVAALEGLRASTCN
ncbi:SAM-dependent methyltransferase [Pseudomonas violetae]|jgi:SAM-dependent methyltransferase|uniref:Nodulation S family protein n=1 Tax=Pseudomonas violetae TaxID=2915813 RepID=A0ABT0EUW6_9PSED|nr:SAM-dependent methyltransferase [Pseudomonas violetae]MCK1789219.1 nodulation S family protein [Pseudomonas violetae]